MKKIPKELFYGLFFLLSLTIVLVAAYALYSSSNFAVTRQVLSSCQVIINQSWLSLRRFFFVSLGAALMLLLIKSVLSLLKTTFLWREFQKNSLPQLPTKLQRLARRHGIDAKFFTVVHSSQSIALTIGFFTPRIIVTTQLMKRLSARELEAVVLHEHHHLTRHHTLLFALATIIAKALFFFPILHDVLLHMKSSLERQADQAATTNQHSSRYVRAALLKTLSAPAPGTSAASDWQTQWFPSFLSSSLPASLTQRLGVPPKHSDFFVHLNKTRFVFSVLSVGIGLFFIAQPINGMTTSRYEPSLPLSAQQCTWSGCLTNCVNEKFNSQPVQWYTPAQWQSTLSE